MAINWDLIRARIIDATVIAVNASLLEGMIRAEKDVPVRKVFAGGRQTVRFKTAGEIEQDRSLRSSLGLAPERLGTPEAIAQAKRLGLNPIRSTQRFGDEEGFARTIDRPSRGSYRDQSGRTRAERGLTRNSANRANAAGAGMLQRLVRESDTGNSLVDESAEFALSGQGRYELRKGRAIARDRAAVSADINARTGKITKVHYAAAGPARLGGGLRSTLRIDEAHATTFPLIKGSLVAGDREHDYAKYQELGTRHNPAHPFLRPRLPEWRDDLPRQLRRSFGRLVR